MKVFSLALIALLALLQQVGAQAHERTLNAMTGEFEARNGLDLTDSTPATDADYLIEDSLDLPVMREQLTITESAQDLTIVNDDIDATYGKMMQDFAATLEDYDASPAASDTASQPNKLLSTLVGWCVETIITLLVLKITFQLNEHRALWVTILPISLTIATVGALLHHISNLSPFHPIQIGISAFLLLMMIRLTTDVHEWPAALQITMTARLASLGMLWLTYTSMIMLFGL